MKNILLYDIDFSCQTTQLLNSFLVADQHNKHSCIKPMKFAQLQECVGCHLKLILELVKY